MSIYSKYCLDPCLNLKTILSMDDKRYYNNSYSDYDNSILINDDGTLVKDYYDDLVKNISNIFKIWENSLKNDLNSSAYTGNVGYSILYLKLHEANLFEDNFLEKAKFWLEQNPDKKSESRISCICGRTGYLATKVFINHALKKDYSKYLMKIRDDSVMVMNEDTPDEILFGRSGYLYALLFIRLKIVDSKNILTDDFIRSVVKKIILSGIVTSKKENSQIPLVYYWHLKAYIGAAHGYSGILYMLLEAKQYLTEEEINTLIKPTIDFICNLKFSNTGNYPSSLTNTSDRLIHWCHGSPGVIHLLLLAYKEFKDNKYLNAALEAGEDIWQRGLLKKGCGLCHGVAGNGYAFLRIYQTTNDPKYLYRALKFAHWCCNYEKNRDRIPDHPFSLFEGLAGTIYFLIDILKPKQSKFPLFQVN